MEKQAKREKKLAEKRAKKIAKEGDPKSPEDKTIPYFGEALFDSNEVYRSRRVYGEKVSIDISSQSVHSVKIEAESPLALYNIDIWGPYVAGAGSRTPTNAP